jgi:flagellar protein FliO/FliZ
MKQLHYFLCLFCILGTTFCAPAPSFAADGIDSSPSIGYPFTAAGNSQNTKDTKSSALNNDTSIIKTLGGLSLVLGLIFVLTKVAKKFHPSISAPDRSLKIISMLSLGSKEKVALIQVGNTQILIGVTTHTINTLLELAEPIDTATNQPVTEKSLLSARTASEFSRKLNEFLLSGQRNK